MFDWQRDVLPVLRATYDAMDEHNTDMLDWEELAPALPADRSVDEVVDVLRQIHRSNYAEVAFVGGDIGVAFIQPTEKGLQVTRGWPVPGQGQVDALLRLLDERIASPETPEEERTRLQRLRDAAGNVGESVLSSLLGAWLSHVAGPGQ